MIKMQNIVLAMYSDELELDEDNPNAHPYLELASINKTRLRPCHKEYLLYTYGRKYYSDLFSKGYHPGILGDCDGTGHSGYAYIFRLFAYSMIGLISC